MLNKIQKTAAQTRRHLAGKKLKNKQIKEIRELHHNTEKLYTFNKATLTLVITTVVNKASTFLLLKSQLCFFCLWFLHTTNNLQMQMNLLYCPSVSSRASLVHKSTSAYYTNPTLNRYTKVKDDVQLLWQQLHCSYHLQKKHSI